MKKFIISAMIVLSSSYSWADVITPGIGLILPTTGVVDTRRSSGDKLNFNFSVIASTLSLATLSGNTFNTAGKLVQLNSSGSIPTNLLSPDATYYINTGVSTQTKNSGLNVLGNVGIGTASPASQVQIFSPSASIGSKLSVTTGSSNLFEVTTSSVAIGIPLKFPDGSVQYSAGGGGDVTTSGNNVLIGNNTFSGDTSLQRMGIGASNFLGTVHLSTGNSAVNPILVISSNAIPSSSQRMFEVTKSSISFGVPAFFTKFSTYSEVWIATTTSYGATNTAIARFSNVIRTIGNCLSYADSSVLGTSVTVNCEGLYNITYGNQYTGAGHFGVSVNSTRLTTAIQRIDMPERAISGVTPSPNIGSVISGDVYLRAGDIVRPHDDPQPAGTLRATEFFHIIGPVTR